MATSFRCWTRCAWLKLKKSGIRSGPRRRQVVSDHCGIGHLADDLNRTGSLWAGKPMLRFSPKISRTCVFDVTRTCDDKQRAHLPKAVEMADRGSGDRGSHNSLIRGCDCLPSRAIAKTTSRDRFQNHRG